MDDDDGGFGGDDFDALIEEDGMMIPNDDDDDGYDGFGGDADEMEAMYADEKKSSGKTTAEGGGGEDEMTTFPDDDDDDAEDHRRQTLNGEGKRFAEDDGDKENAGPRDGSRANKKTKATIGTDADVDGESERFDFEAAARAMAKEYRGGRKPLKSNARDMKPERDAANIDGESMPMTLADGSRVYIKVEPADKPIVTREEIYARAEGESLLSRPIEDMLDDFEKARYQRALEEAQALERGEDVGAKQPTEDATKEMTKGELMAERLRGKIRGMMWSQKYAPKGFTELLSSEYSNREVVHWIKAWDKVVFGRDPPPATVKKFYADRYADKNGQKRRTGHVETHTQMDVHNRPMQKILLISGPPGAGKTTLAHIAAKHCGYQPIEINASDDRSASTLKMKLADAVHTQSVFSKKKPTCLIIDEIDGVHHSGSDRSAIWMVLNSLKNVKGRAPLSRPIIAICNDLYAPVLRPLREVAKIIRMKAPTTTHLTARIRDVCVKENVNAEPRAIALVVDRVENDIRAALNAIQLIAKTTDSVTLTDVSNSNGGSKDIKHPAWSMWQDLLRGRHTFQKSRLESEARLSHVDRMRLRVENFQDNDTILDGLFENIPHVRFQDGNMHRLTNAIDAVLDGVTFQKKSFTTGDHSLRQYASSCIMSVHSCSTHADVLTDNIEWPKTGKAARERNNRMGVLNSRRDAMDIKILRRPLNEDVTETLPYLNTIWAPELRSVGTSFMSEDEKKKLNDIVALMRAQGLSYKPAAVANEQSWRTAANALALYPPVDDFIKFGGGVKALKSVERLTWKERREREREEPETSASKHINLVPRRSVNNSLRSIIAAALETDAERRSGHAAAQASTEARQQRAEAKARVALGVAGGNRHKMKPSVANGPTYKYNEGFTTGVRRTVLMRDLFPHLKS